MIFDGPKVQAVGTTAHSGSTLPGPPHNGPMGYATWERTLRGAPPPAPPPQVWFSYTQAPNSFQHFRQHRATEAASVQAYPTSVQSPPCQHPPRNPGTLKHQECFRIKTQNMKLGIELRSLGLPALELPTCLRSLATVQVISYYYQSHWRSL